MRYVFIWLIIILPFFAQAQDEILDQLFRNSYTVWELQRNDVGLYRDSKLFNGEDYHPCSVANVGIGLISLCIADSMGWETAAVEKAILTLKTITGHTPGVEPDRNESGFYRHFIDMETGERFWNSEYSTIDTEILVAGALFANSYFQNDSISHYAMELWHSVSHELAIADEEEGKIYLTMEENGFGTPNSITSVYNEYMIVAWMAMNSTTDISSPAYKLWNSFYFNPNRLPYTAYEGNMVLTDREGHFLSSFTHLFNYYLCNYFTVSEEYLEFFKQAQNADMAWWAQSSVKSSWEWGNGAGTGPEGYYADKINDNKSRVVSPHIIAGFLPIYPGGKEDLKTMWRNSKGRYRFNGSDEEILWRYSLEKSDWAAPEIQGIDYSTMLFGLAGLPEYLGPTFFLRHNDFFSGPTTNVMFLQEQESNYILLQENPVYDSLIFQTSKTIAEEVSVRIVDVRNQMIKEERGLVMEKGVNNGIGVSDIQSGMYFLMVIVNDKKWATKKFVKY